MEPVDLLDFRYCFGNKEAMFVGFYCVPEACFIGQGLLNILMTTTNFTAYLWGCFSGQGLLNILMTIKNLTVYLWLLSANKPPPFPHDHNQFYFVILVVSVDKTYSISS